MQNIMFFRTGLNARHWGAFSLLLLYLYNAQEPVEAIHRGRNDVLTLLNYLKTVHPRCSNRCSHSGSEVSAQ